eukprot:COSAG01_NODE_6495_length_3632_cov_3.699544_1_plen_481_part_00
MQRTWGRGSYCSPAKLLPEAEWSQVMATIDVVDTPAQKQPQSSPPHLPGVWRAYTVKTRGRGPRGHEQPLQSRRKPVRSVEQAEEILQQVMRLQVSTQRGGASRGGDETVEPLASGGSRPTTPRRVWAPQLRKLPPGASTQGGSTQGSSPRGSGLLLARSGGARGGASPASRLSLMGGCRPSTAAAGASPTLGSSQELAQVPHHSRPEGAVSRASEAASGEEQGAGGPASLTAAPSAANQPGSRTSSSAAITLQPPLQQNASGPTREAAREVSPAVEAPLLDPHSSDRGQTAALPPTFTRVHATLETRLGRTIVQKRTGASHLWRAAVCGASKMGPGGLHYAQFSLVRGGGAQCGAIVGIAATGVQNEGSLTDGNVGWGMHAASGKLLSGALTVGQVAGWKCLMRGETLGLLLNLSNGTLSVFRNSEYLGTPIKGLPRNVGSFCWMVLLGGKGGTAVGIEAMQPPPVPYDGTRVGRSGRG